MSYGDDKRMDGQENRSCTLTLQKIITMCLLVVRILPLPSKKPDLLMVEFTAQTDKNRTTLERADGNLKLHTAFKDNWLLIV